MTDYGVTPSGFVVKPFSKILSAKLAMATQLFGPNVDLRSTSALRKMLDVATIEDQEHWKALEGAYYSNFVSTAMGDALDLLGEDLGLARGNQPAAGHVTFTLAGGLPGRLYVLPVGTLVETASAPGSATAAATNAAAFTGGNLLIDDETYRGQLLRLPRNLFTVEAVRAAVLNVDGVRDCKLSDPVGGVDVSLSIFNSFVFDRRRFGQPRFLGTPYFFDVLVAPQTGYAWDTIGGVEGLHDAVASAVDAVRPIGIFPNIRIANGVNVGVRASVIATPGTDPIAIGTALKNVFENRVAGLSFGDAVLASEVIRDFMNVTGVSDVQNLHHHFRRSRAVSECRHRGRPWRQSCAGHQRDRKLPL